MPSTQPAAASSGQSFNLGLIGAGRIGLVHCRAAEAIPNAKVVVVADFFIEAAQKCAAQFGIPEAIKDWQPIMANPDVHAVVVCSPSDTHCEIIIAAARAGKHIFCEKPIDYDLGRIDEALKAVAESGVKLQLGFQRRFDTDFRRVRAAVQSGEIGEPYMISIISRDPGLPPIAYLKQSGGLFFDMMIHDFDMARFITGSEVTEVTATAASFDPEVTAIGDVTSAIVTLKFENNAVGTIQCCRKAVYGYDQRLEILGSKGSAEIANRYPNTATISTETEIKRDLPLNFFMDRYKEAYAREVAEFVDAVVNNKPTPVAAADGRAPVVLAYAAVKSLKEKRTVAVSEVESSHAKL
jgi:myo-inositol 2-dehydrogenase / D-chiro-inositol 1-dehydrogenase